jgi:glycosyltransferase involved in cell wall biosynthesis
MSEPWLTVALPVYNRERYLPEALGSIAAQADDGIEVIAVDDGSTDGTIDILRSHATRMRMEIVEQKHGGNWMVGANRALHMARGHYFCILHDDDLWLPGRAQALRGICQNGGPALVLHSCWYIDERGKRIGRLTCPLPKGRPLPGEAVLERLLIQNFIGVPCATVRRDVAVGAGGFDETIWWAPDWDMAVKAATVGPTVYLGSALGAYRIHQQEGSFSGKWGPDALRDHWTTVVDRGLRSWQATGRLRADVEALSRFNIEFNAQLLAFVRGEDARLGRLLAGLVRLGPRRWWRYLRDSRILQRGAARARVAFAERRHRRRG